MRAHNWRNPFLGVEDGMRVLDACAAPGGKTMHILEHTRCELVALDRDNRRLGKIWENLARLGLSATTRQADATNLKSWWDEKAFDRVLLDVPCTASGVMRRHPGWQVAAPFRRHRAIRAAATPASRSAVAGRQARRQIALHDVLGLCRGKRSPGRRFSLQARRGRAVRAALAAGLTRHGAGQLLPASGAGEDNHDGFFYALLEKRGG
jgi:16S rRNA (cytosine967-C5)-methyltransferase